MTRQELEMMITKEVAKQVKTFLPALIKEAINPMIIKKVVADSFASIIMESTSMPVRPTGNSAKRTALTEGAVAYENDVWPEMENSKAMAMMGYAAQAQGRPLLTVDSMVDGLSPTGQPVPINRVPEYTQRALNDAAMGGAKKFLDKMNEFTARKRGR